MTEYERVHADEVETCVRLYTVECLSCPEIGRRLRMDRGTVTKRLDEAGVAHDKGLRSAPARALAIAELTATGLTRRQAGRRLDRDRVRAAATGPDPSGEEMVSRPAALPEAEILALYVKAGLAYDVVAARLGIAKDRVLRFLQAQGVMRGRSKYPEGLTVPERLLPHVRSAILLAHCTVHRVNPPDLPEADRDDYNQVARFAALRALATYDPTAGAHWRTWVISKVRWAIQDELRHLAVYSRTEGRRQRQEPGEADVPARARPVSLDMLRSTEPEEGGICEVGYDWDEDAWVQTQVLAAAIRALPGREQFVIRARLAERSTDEIAAALDVCATTIHTWERDARARLRESLGEEEA
jgi:RNA polymerase sigma factor (sigma-70 family)